MDHTEHKGVSPLVVGAIAAAGAAAATYYFTNKDGRHKIDDTVSKVKDKAKDTYHSMLGKAEEKKDELESKTRRQNLSV